MSVNALDCCRTCLSVQNLHPIFTRVEYHEKYSEVIQKSAGIKVDLNDGLPQQMCTQCVSFINESNKFRSRCAEAEKQLLSRNDQKLTVKFESKTTNGATIEIDISDIIDEDFRDYDDNLPLDTLQYCSFVAVEKVDSKPNEFDCKDDIKASNIEKPKVKQPNNKKTRDKTKKTRLKEIKKDNEKERERNNRVREEIECEYCHKILTSKLSMRNHYKIHTGFDIVCEHCGKKFITKRLLLMHCRAKHGYEKTDKCSFCEYRASNAEQVKIHERLHTGEKPYVCKECGAGFHRKSSYLQHVAIHLPEKTVQCDLCPARFKSVTLMRIHKNRHRARAYTYTCRVCANTFARRRNVARHLQRIHGLQTTQEHIQRSSVLP